METWETIHPLKRSEKWHTNYCNTNLGGGVNYLYFQPLPGEMDPIWLPHIFQMGWWKTTNHQAEKVFLNKANGWNGRSFRFENLANGFLQHTASITGVFVARLRAPFMKFQIWHPVCRWSLEMAVWFITRCLHMGMHPSHRIRLGAPGWVWHLLAIEVNSVSGALVVFGGCHAVRSKSTWCNTSRIFHSCQLTIQTTGDFKHAQPVLVWFVVDMEKKSDWTGWELSSPICAC